MDIVFSFKLAVRSKVVQSIELDVKLTNYLFIKLFLRTAVEAVSYVVRSGMPVQFKSERSCNLTGICNNYR